VRGITYDVVGMKALDRVRERRRRKAHERYLTEREWQRLLAEKDTEETVRDAATVWGVAGQATSGPGSGL
jgi:integrase